MELVGILRSAEPRQTHLVGVSLGRLLRPGHLVGLVGPLGAGKTCLVSGVAEGAGVPSSVYVSSPSFTLINEYVGRITLVHMDFYRLTDVSELVEIGVEDYYRSGCGACLVEWFDRFPDDAPPDRLEVTFAFQGPGSRTLELRASDEEHRDLARRWIAATQRGEAGGG